jgi:hypothetical protein
MISSLKFVCFSYNCCSPWRSIRVGWDNFSQFVYFEVGNCTRIRFWHDIWCGTHSLKEWDPDLYACSVDQNASVQSILDRHMGREGREHEISEIFMIENWS